MLALIIFFPIRRAGVGVAIEPERPTGGLSVLLPPGVTEKERKKERDGIGRGNS